MSIAIHAGVDMLGGLGAGCVSGAELIAGRE